MCYKYSPRMQSSKNFAVIERIDLLTHHGGHPVFTYRTMIHLRDTDATGALYFPEQFRFALETLEEYIKSRGFSLATLLSGHFLFPVVHATADYLAPLQVSDEIEICLSSACIGDTSVALDYQISALKRQIQVGRVHTVHVAVCRASKQAIRVPEALREIFAPLCRTS